jgi:predicted site-specific integrase-resolvase
MKSKEVLKILKITRPTLCKYVRTGKIKGKLLVNGFYDYDKESVYKLFDKDIERVNVIYCRVSTPKQKQDLENQIQTVNSFCMNNGIKISDIYKDIGSGINFDRKEFTRLLHDVINYKIDKIFVTYKDRLCRLSFDLFNNLFKEFGCEIVVLNEIDNDKLIEKEIFNEIIGLIHCFSMKIYSNRRKEKLKLVEKDLQLDEDCEEEKCN